MKLIRVFGAVAVSLSLCAPALVLAKTVNFTSELLPSSEVPPNDTTGKGHLYATYDTSTKSFGYKVTYDGLSGAATAAHFHGPAAEGQNAGPVIPIPKDALASPIQGKQTLNDQQEADLLAGKWYFNVHTAAHPGGEIRGQLTPGM
ncbi:CHRD domain-containing protein [Pararobbsia silviterrae]|uniref:CHRD domain-containing protein n=1 Tax=Pararobbsia silviterrae TaxID=1792498 RepID=A0A494XMM2_9BURK|nr:CHRD domain-containing protein [Pararobbsia silviterrae]RKP51937.1 CHRD domain-containing protein [Pararobbsia silviterrae]